MATLTGYKQDRVGIYIDKDPFAVLDYSLSWDQWMPSGDGITSGTVTAETISGDSAPLVIDSTTVTGTTLLSATVSGGTAGNIYNVEYRITTSNGLKDSRNIRIKVLERQLA